MAGTDPDSGQHLVFAVGDPVSDAELDELDAVAWDSYTPRSFQAVLRRSLCWVTARVDRLLVGFVYIAWDGGRHAFVLTPCRGAGGWGYR